MPTYQYACTACEHRFETVQSFTEDSLTECPECHGRLRKVFNAVGVVFKGSGFYRNDSRAPEGSSGGSSSGGSSGKSTSSTTSTETKSASSGESSSGGSSSNPTPASSGSSSSTGSSNSGAAGS